MECSRFFANDKPYMKEMSKKRITYEDDIPIDCESIRSRNFFPTFPSSKEELEYPLAYARIVYKDYIFLEMELAASYAPQNYYCYTIDVKSPSIFKTRIRNLAKCFPNVIVADREYYTNGSGSMINYALVECLNLLSAYPWNYVFSLNNHDVIMRTNYELVQIFKWFRGANDVMVNKPNMDRVNKRLDWTFAGLRLFRNRSRNYLPDGSSPKLRWVKGNFECAISRPMVDFMLNELDLTIYMAQIEGRFAIDELFVPTLTTTDELEAPGGFTRACLENGYETTHITRHNVWSWTIKNNPCMSKKFRHHLCIFGIEDLYRLARLPHIFANKMMPRIDFGAMLCWYEHMFNRSHLEPPNVKHLNPDYYLSLPHVRYHHERLDRGYVDLKKFNCSFKYRECRKDLSCM